MRCLILKHARHSLFAAAAAAVAAAAVAAAAVASFLIAFPHLVMSQTGCSAAKGIPEAISACEGEVYVVTTKQTRFASALLDHAGERDGRTHHRNSLVHSPFLVHVENLFF